MKTYDRASVPRRQAVNEPKVNAAQKMAQIAVANENIRQRAIELCDLFLAWDLAQSTANAQKRDKVNATLLTLFSFGGRIARYLPQSTPKTERLAQSTLKHTKIRQATALKHALKHAALPANLANTDLKSDNVTLDNAALAFIADRIESFQKAAQNLHFSAQPARDLADRFLAFLDFYNAKT